MTSDENKKQFLSWEATTHDTIDFKKIYVDMAGDILAGLMLSEIVYWFLPGKRGENKLRVQKEGEYWLAVSRAEWWERIRLTPRQADTAIDKLLKGKLLIKKVFKFDGAPTTHIRINWDVFLSLFNSKSQIGEITESVISISPKLQHPLTETTTETTEKPLSPATQDDSETLPTTVVSTPAKATRTKPVKRLFTAEVKPIIVEVLLTFCSQKTHGQMSKAELNQFIKRLTPVLSALQPLDDEQMITPTELSAAFGEFHQKWPNSSYPASPDKVVKMLTEYRVKVRKNTHHGRLIPTPAIDGLLAQPAPTYADSIDINDVRIIGETK